MNSFVLLPFSILNSTDLLNLQMAAMVLSHRHSGPLQCFHIVVIEMN